MWSFPSCLRKNGGKCVLLRRLSPTLSSSHWLWADTTTSDRQIQVELKHLKWNLNVMWLINLASTAQNQNKNLNYSFSIINQVLVLHFYKWHLDAMFDWTVKLPHFGNISLWQSSRVTLFQVMCSSSVVLAFNEIVFDCKCLVGLRMRTAGHWVW